MSRFIQLRSMLLRFESGDVIGGVGLPDGTFLLLKCGEDGYEGLHRWSNENEMLKYNEGARLVWLEGVNEVINLDHLAE